MNSKKVLNKIFQLLSLEEEMHFTDARTADGTILQSPTFDLGEDVEVVHEDGTKTPAPDGEHEIALKDSEGKEVVIRVVTKDGKITERENVEEAQPEVPEKGEEEMADADAEKVKAEPIPAAEEKDKVNEVPDMKGQVKSGTLKMAEDTQTAEPIPADTDSTEGEGEDEAEVEINLGKKMEEMAYRIQELADKIAKMEEVMQPPVDSQVTQEEAGIKMAATEEDELPKLDGAPIEEGVKFSSEMTNKKNYGKSVKDAQSNFLSKLYK
jgi:hypothetical protein